MELQLPDEFTRNTIAICGTRGRVWLDDLPALLIRLENEWNITIEPPFPNIAYNFVAPANASDGTPAVIKVAIPQDDTEIFAEARYLGELNGDGAVRLLKMDRQFRAMLIERAMPGRTLAEVYRSDPLRAVDIAIDLLRRVERHPPDDTTYAIFLSHWFDNLKRAIGTDFPLTSALQAYEFYLANRNGLELRYLHGDFHLENIVSSGDGFVLIDPKGLIGPIGYEIAVFLNNFNWWLEDEPSLGELLDAAVAKFAAAFAMSEREVREWAYAQAILSAWWTFDEMPDLYDNEVANGDVWQV